ncbi:CD209 antigen-like protein C [Hemibagrus wyckioides]|uniref:CD209 antigen-like protein C n=1 Tax=Hemibagrus wyckioides TaxID=337641 RepID=UPI00266D4DEC|nr:CD209 antigen-like protein C [Hemibagrus wyckioides]
MEMRNCPPRSRPQCSHHQRQQPRRLGYKQRGYRVAAVCFGLLSILLAVAIIILAIKYTQQQIHYKRNLTEQINQLQEENAALQRMLTDIDEQAKLGWIYFHSSFYFISAQTKSWIESREDCKRNGADLVIIKTEEAQDFLVKQLGSDRAWIGLHDRDTEGTWKWVDGTPLTTAYWAPREPNNDHNEDCAEILGFTGKEAWNDVPCTKKVRWICEKPASL